MHEYPLLNHRLWPNGNSFYDTELGSRLRTLPKLGSPHDAGPWAAGGAVRRALCHEPLGRDIDFFFRGPSSYELYLDKVRALPHNPLVIKEDKRTVEFLISPNGGTPFVIDLVRGSYFPDVAALLSSFDFTCCQFALDDTNVYVGELAMLHAGQRILRAGDWGKLARSYPHMVRYMQDGWRAGRSELDAMLAAVGADQGVLFEKPDYSGM